MSGTDNCYVMNVIKGYMEVKIVNKSRIEYCDHTLNIVTGCRHGCEYCYARTMSLRFSGNVKLNIRRTDKYRKDEGGYVLDEPFIGKSENRSYILSGLNRRCTDIASALWIN